MSASDAMQLSEQRRALLRKLLADKGVTSRAGSRRVIDKTPAGEPAQLSFAQERMWFFEQLVPGTAVYSLPAAIRMTGPLDQAALETALDAALGRHEVLRAALVSDRGRPALRPGDWKRFPIVAHDLSELPKEQRDIESRRMVDNEIETPFDLGRGPLARVTLLRLAAAEHILVLNMHHIVGDAWSWDVVLNDVAAAYVAQGATSPTEPIQYHDYARWQRARYANGELAEQLDYWRKRLADTPAPLELPSDRVRPAIARYRGSVVHIEIAPDTVAALRAVGQREGATLFMVALAVFKVLLHRYTRQTDIIVGTPIANREQPQVEPLVGLFVNTLLMRTEIHSEKSFLDVLRELRQTTMEAFANQDVPFEKLVEELQPTRGLSSSPFFQVMFAFRAASAGQRLGSLRLEPVDVHNGTTKRDLTLQLVETGQGLHGQIEFDTDLFDMGTMQRLSGHYLRLAAAAGTDPDRAVGNMPWLTATEEQDLDQWSRGGPALAAQGCVHELFEAQAARTPGAIAVAAGPVTLTYAELDVAANRLAGQLIDLGVQAEDAVGIHLDRSAEMVVAVLGVLKAGAAYVPVDIDGPVDRRMSILDDARVKAVVSGEWAKLDGPWPIIHPCTQEMSPLPRPSLGRPAGKAYVLYTSGSTGKPKGVVVEHRQLTGYLQAIIDRIDLGEPSSYAMVQPLTVDSSVTVLFPPLITGGILHVISREVALDAAAMADYFQANGIDVLKIAPSHLSALQRSSRFTEILPRRRLIIGGEASGWDWVQRLQKLNPACRVFNHYGPTEATVGVTTFDVSGELGAAFSVTPLGSPLGGSNTYVLDEQMRPLPIGVPGELYVGGVNVARCYGDQPVLTAQAFVPDPFGAAGQRLYRTGDMVRRLANGAIEFLGRADDQVKIRGFRVELGEIESAIKAHAAVGDAVVTVRSDAPGDPRVVAYVVAAGGDVDVAGLREHAQARLPRHMVPWAFVMLDSLPLSAHGKVDRKALPDPARETPDDRAPGEGPATETQRMVAEIWRGLLTRDHIGVDENFFEAGGHSLLLVRLHHELQEAAGRQFPLIELFNVTTIAAQADFLSGQDQKGAVLQRGLERGRKQSELMRRRSKSMKPSGENHD